MGRLLGLLGVLTLVAGCQALAPSGQAALGHLPATYSGVLPCADCAAIRLTLALHPDHLYLLEQAYQGRGAGGGAAYYYRLGRWRVGAHGVLRLQTEGSDRLFRVISSQVLRQLDGAGQAIGGRLNFDLRRTAGPLVLQRPLPLTGLYRLGHGSAVFRECGTGADFTIVIDPTAHELRRAYAATRQAPARPLLVRIDGWPRWRPGRRPELRISQLQAALPRLHCPGG